MTFPIPDSALANHIAVLGKTGSGKTSTSKLIVEHVVAQGARVCILDPIKSDWWGLISSSDGKRPGLPFQILGGPRGHVPLHSSAGKAIGEVVATGALPHSIIDMADFEAGGLQRFFVDFAPVLLRKMRGVLYLVVEESHEFAPKERAGFGAENMAIHFAKKLATAGRSKGIRLIVATQSTQSLHNAVLGSCETLITHRFTTPAQQEPVVKWLKANTTKDVADEIAQSLSSLPTGTGWVCSGEARFFEKVAFPRIKTFDNSATPSNDSAALEVRSATVDVDKLRTIIGEAVKQAEANDPVKLKAEIARLNAELAKKPTETVSERVSIERDEQAIDDAYKAGDADGFKRGVEWGHADGRAQATRHARETIGAIEGQALSFAGTIAAGHLSTLDRILIECEEHKSKIEAPSPAVSHAATARALTAPAAPRPQVPTAGARPSPAASGDGSLTGAMLDTLQALAWWAALGIAAPTRKQLAAMLKIEPGGSTMRSRLAALRAPGLIDYPDNGSVALTEAGRRAAPTPDVQRSLIETIRSSLTPADLQTFDAIPARGHITREALGKALAVEAGGSTMRSRLANLTSRELIHYPKPGLVARQEWVR